MAQFYWQFLPGHWSPVQASSAWKQHCRPQLKNHPFFFVFPLVVERHLLCIWLRPQAALFSLVTAVQWEWSSQFLLCVCSPEQIRCLLVSLPVLWKVHFHRRQWNRHLTQSLACLLWRLVSCYFLCVWGRRECLQELKSPILLEMDLIQKAGSCSDIFFQTSNIHLHLPVLGSHLCASGHPVPYCMHLLRCHPSFICMSALFSYFP